MYPLTPCLHRPTFVANLTARRDKTDPLFFALVLTVLASTLVQVPRSLVNLDKTEVESLARRCVRVARVKVAYIYEVNCESHLRLCMPLTRRSRSLSPAHSSSSATCSYCRRTVR